MAISSLSKIAHNNSTTGSLTLPATIAAGDLLVIIAFADSGSGTPADVTPSGFTEIGTFTSAATRDSLFYKIADGTEDSASVSVLTGSGQQASLVVQFQANEAITAVTAGSSVGECTDGNPTSKTITASSGAAPLVVIATWANVTTSSAISPRTQSPAMTEVNATTHMYLGWLFYASSPVDQSFDMADEGISNSLNGAYLQLTGVASTIKGRFFSVF